MPICDDPNATGYFWLKSDEDKPLAERPVFLCKFITRAKSREIDRILQQAYETPNNSGCYLLLMQSIRAGIVGWRNFGDLEYSEENLAEKLTDREIWELARGWPGAVSLSEDDLKNFGSARSSAAGAPANPAAESAQKTSA